jgi:integrase
MRNQTYLHLREGTYYFRIKIPLDLQDHYGSRRELKWSLKTKERPQAIQRLRQALARAEREFQEHRNIVQIPHTAPPLNLIFLSDEQIQNICNTYLDDMLTGDDQGRRDGIHRVMFEENKTAAIRTEALLRDAVAKGNHEAIKEFVANYCRILNIELDCDKDSYQRLGYAFLHAMTVVATTIRKRNEGEPIITSSIIPAEAPKIGSSSNSDGFSLTTLYEDWLKAVKDRPATTVDDVKRIIDAFDEYIYKKPASQIKRSDVNQFRDQLLNDEELHYKTVEKKLSLLSAVLQYAYDNEKLEVNPAARIRITRPKVRDKSRVPYDREDLKRIFTGPIYSRRDRPKGGGGEAAAWLPLLALYTGARIEELAQLNVEDIKSHTDTEWYIEIGDYAEGQSVKTNSSRRRVPIHPLLINAGLIRYRNRLESAGSTRLFPDLKSDCKGNISGNFSKWWGRYARKQFGIKDERKVFHSFRHAFKERCRDDSIIEEIHDALTGHTGRSVGRSYGGEQYPLRPLFEAIKNLNYPDLVVPVIES